MGRQPLWLMGAKGASCASVYMPVKCKKISCLAQVGDSNYVGEG